MTDLTEYALMAGASYISNRTDFNKFPVPEGWSESVEDRRTKPSGFEATYFTNGTEIVISYAGTDPNDILGDMAADAAMAFGTLSAQLKQAADYYLAVKAGAPQGAKITLTGHSLGGGLASLIAVMFGEAAVTFDQAPFLKSAQFFVDTDFEGNQTLRSVAQGLRSYLTDHATAAQLAKLDAYILANDPLSTPSPNPVILKEGEDNRILVRDWSSGKLGLISGTLSQKLGAGGTACNGYLRTAA